MSNKISLVVPIGQFSYFVYACLRNVFETCGDPACLDFAFIIGRDVTPEVLHAFWVAKRLYPYPFRVIVAPFNAWPSHQKLLDWAIREANITDWVIFQHCDLFWTHNNWLRPLLGILDRGKAVMCMPWESPYCYRGDPVPLVGDFFGVYNRHQLIQRNCLFRWGVIGSDIPVSSNLVAAMNDIHPRLQLGKSWVDGSIAMGLELMTDHQRPIGYIVDPSVRFFHIGHFFRDIGRRKGNYILCNDFFSLVYFSYLSSFCIEKCEVEHIAIPWSVFNAHARLCGYNLTPYITMCKFLELYGIPKEVVGMDSMGLRILSRTSIKLI